MSSFLRGATPRFRRGGKVLVWMDPLKLDDAGLEAVGVLVQPVCTEEDGWEIWWVQLERTSDPEQRMVHPLDMLVAGDEARPITHRSLAATPGEDLLREDL